MTQKCELRHRRGCQPSMSAMHGLGTDTKLRSRAPKRRDPQPGPAGVGRIAPRRGHRRTDCGGLMGEAELRHEARAALLGVEAAASGLTQHRLLTAEQIDELSQGLVAECGGCSPCSTGASANPRRSTCMTRSHRCSPAPAPRASTSVRPCPLASRWPAVPTAPRRSLLALLTNAQRHAPGSPVEVRASTVDGVAVYVEDRGPVVPESLQERVFERHMQAVGSDGSGLGLFIARRLMHDQGGSIAVEPRAGGGSSFVLRPTIAHLRHRGARSAPRGQGEPNVAALLHRGRNAVAPRCRRHALHRHGRIGIPARREGTRLRFARRAASRLISWRRCPFEDVGSAGRGAASMRLEGP